MIPSKPAAFAAKRKIGMKSKRKQKRILGAPPPNPRLLSPPRGEAGPPPRKSCFGVPVDDPGGLKNDRGGFNHVLLDVDVVI